MTQPTEPKPYPPGPTIDRARVWRALDYRVDAAERAVIDAATAWADNMMSPAAEDALVAAVQRLKDLGAA